MFNKINGYWGVLAMSALFASIPQAAVKKTPSEFWKKLMAGEKQSLVVFGTSVSHDGSAPWGPMLRDQLKTESGTDVSYTNLSDKGSYSKWGSENIGKVISRKPNAVTIEFMTNDAVGRFECDLACSEAYWRVMLDALKNQAPETEVFAYVSAPPWDKDTWDGDCMDIPGSNKANWSKRNCPVPIEDYMNLLRQLASEYGLYLVDTWDAFQAEKDKGDSHYKNYLHDGHHPTSMACEKIIVPAFMEAFKGSEKAPVAFLPFDKKVLEVGEDVTFRWEFNTDAEVNMFMDILVGTPPDVKWKPLQKDKVEGTSFDWKVTEEVSGLSLLGEDVWIRIADYENPESVTAVLGPLTILPEGFVPVEIVVDNTESGKVTIEGDWHASTATSGYQGSNYHASNSAGAKAIYSVTIPSDGTYDVLLNYTSADNRASNAKVIIAGGDVNQTQLVNMKTGGGTWASLGQHVFGANNEVTVTLSTDDADGYVVADAVKVVKMAGQGSAIVYRGQSVMPGDYGLIRESGIFFHGAVYDLIGRTLP